MTPYEKLQKKIFEAKKFNTSSEEIATFITNLSKENYLNIASEIESIPESVAHDSTPEKIYAKVSDMILSRAFNELGLKSSVLNERGNAADVYAESRWHNYSLVGDAKIYRLSRTAKNQKDFKVTGLDTWRNDSEYAVLCSPYFCYPKTKSQVYSESLTRNVSLFSWEWMLFLIKNDVIESPACSLADIWNFAETYRKNVLVSDIQKRYLEGEGKFIENFVVNQNGKLKFTIDDIFKYQVGTVSTRAEVEKSYWADQKKIIRNYSKERAITELIEAKKIDNKIKQIDSYVRRIKREFENK